MNKYLKAIELHIYSIGGYFLPIDNKKIVFNNFFGTSYDGNPRYICEELHNRLPDYELVWLVKKHNNEIPQYVRQALIGSKDAVLELSTAKVWVDSIRNSFKPLKKRKQIYLQTWHGSFALKLVEGQTYKSLNKHYVKRAKRDGKLTDGIIACTSLQEEIFKQYFWLNPGCEILKTGLPRNDIFFQKNNREKYLHYVHSYFNIPSDEKIVLYMPTFRDNGSFNYGEIDFEKIINCFEHKYRVSCYMIIKLHPNDISLTKQIHYSNHVLNGSSFPSSDGLCMGSDFLITDYSSIFYDFLLLKKPVILFTPDYIEYKAARGLTDIYEKLPFPRVDNIESLLTTIENYNDSLEQGNAVNFLSEIHSFDNGDASEKVVNWIADKINTSEKRGRKYETSNNIRHI